jgi:hypothetical protein
MMTTLDSQLVPGTYNPLRFTFLIWVMVIVGRLGQQLGRCAWRVPDLVALDHGGAARASA